MIRTLVAGVMLLGAVSHASAADWQYLSHTSEGTVIYDASSVRTATPLTRVWLKEIWDKPVLNPPAKPAVYKLTHWAVNCADRSIAVGQTDIYGDDNTHIISLPGKPNEFHDIVPESTGDELAGKICKR
jgi:hypothetical protein